jgi:squalene-hopene/tetraprenyl-beta-curcumene cyclase
MLTYRSTLALCLPVVLALGAPLPALAQQTQSPAAQARAAIQRGAAFLLKHQNDNGSFGVIPGAPVQGELGITGLVTRALANVPEGLRDAALERAQAQAISWMLSHQREDGAFGQEGTGLVTYRTAVAITALVAADPKEHADAIARARDYLAGTQFSEEHGLSGDDPEASPYYGGWGYDKKGAKPDADMSNTTMALEALREAGLDESSPVWRRAAVFLRRCQNRSESNDVRAGEVAVGDDGGMMYDPALDRGKSEPVTRPDGKVEIPSYASMTYAGLLSMVHAHLEKDDPRVQAAWDWIRRNYTLDENRGLGTHTDPTRGQQGLYYYFMVFAKALDVWGEDVVPTAEGENRRWAEELVVRLAALQREDGSWYNDEPRWWERDPVLVTGYTLQAMERALPWLERGSEPAGEAGDAPGGTGGR